VDEQYYNTYGPRSLVHTYATDTDDPTMMPRWGNQHHRPAHRVRSSSARWANFAAIESPLVLSF
jgi:hypothetical protein